MKITFRKILGTAILLALCAALIAITAQTAGWFNACMIWGSAIVFMSLLSLGIFLLTDDK